MSLDWNLTGIENCDEVCSIPDPDNPERRIMNPTTEALIWSTMVVGFGEITEKNADDFYERLSTYESLRGTFLRNGDGEPVPLTAEDVRNHIGLRTNAFPNWSKAKFAKRMGEIAKEIAAAKARKASI